MGLINRIDLDPGPCEEYLVGAAAKPGQLVELYNDAGVTKVRPHTGGAVVRPLFLKEDAYHGKGIGDTIAVGDTGYVHVPAGNKRVLGLLQAGASVANAGLLISAGDGSLIPSASAGFDRMYASTADSAAVTNTTSATAFDKYTTVPANFLKAGDIIRFKALAVVTGQNSTDTVLLTVKLGSTTIQATAAKDAAVNDIVYVQGEIVIRTVGASGTMIAAGTNGNGVPGTVTALPWTLASTAVDTTAALDLKAYATWSVASASNTIVLREMTVDLSRAAGGSEAFEPVAQALETVDNSAGSTDVALRIRVLE